MKNTWPVPHIDAVLQDPGGAEAFAVFNSTSRYWHLPSSLDSQYFHTFMTPDGVMHRARRTQEECNRVTKFQACVEQSYSELREKLLAWLDDLALFDRTEDGLLRLLRRFFGLSLKILQCHFRNLFLQRNSVGWTKH